MRADVNLAKDVLTCHPLVPSLYKSRHPDDTDKPNNVGGSSEDEAEGMEEVLGVTKRLYKPSPAQPFLAQPSPTQPSPETLEDRDTVRVPRRDLKRAAKLLSVGKKVKLPVSASREEVPFTVPNVMAGETDCALCHQAFRSTRSL